MWKFHTHHLGLEGIRMRVRSLGRASILLLALAVSACSADQPTNSHETADQRADGNNTNETFNQRVERQTKALPTIKRNQLPAPEGDPQKVALKAINDNAMKRGERCMSIARAERFDSDGSIIATCRNGQDYRVFRIEGMLNTIALKCKSAREMIVVDPCDADSVRSGHDDSVDRVMASIAKL